MKRKLYFLLLFSTVLLSCTFFNETGKQYLSIRGLTQDQNEKGYVLIGTFGDSWPAKVVEVKVARHEISFESESFSNRVYSERGYKFKVLKLLTGNHDEIIVVLRSKK